MPSANREPILRRVYLFFFISGMCILLTIFFHFMLEMNQNRYIGIEHNERVKTEIGLLIQQKIKSIQIQFQYMLLADTASELHNANQEIVDTIRVVKQALLVIEEGGEYSEDIFVNFGNKEQITQTFHYTAASSQAINLSALEMRTNLARLEDMRSEYYWGIRQEITSANTPKKEKLTLFYKKIAPFFTRLVESSNRLYIESLDAFSMAVEERETQARLFNMISMVVLPLLAIMLGWFGMWILRDINRLMKERASALQALTETNENLETLVEARTTALRQEVGERKLTEQRFSEQAHFLTNVIESLGHPFYVIDANDYTISMANQTAKDHALTNSRHCYSMTHGLDIPCSGEQHPCPLKEVKKTGKPVIMEHYHPMPNGNLRYVEIHGYPIFDDHGNVVQMIEYSLDITDKHEAQEALEQYRDELEIKVNERTKRLKEEVDSRITIQRELEASERHFRKLIEGIQDIVVILDNKGNMSYASPSVESILGYSPDELIGESFKEYVVIEVNGKQFPPSDEFFLEAIEQEGPREHMVLDNEGNTRMMESFIQDKFNDPTINGLLITSRDISFRKQAEQAQLRLNAVVEQNPSSVVITDTNGDIEYVNPQFEKVTGYSREEVVGQNPRILNSGLTDPQMFKDMYDAIAKGEVWQGEFINKKRSGDFYTENVIIAPIKDDRGKITHYVALKENISELKKARIQAESANKAKSEFLSRMSHELRTPLNAIIGFSNLLMDDKSNPLQEKQATQAHRIHSAGLHLMQMISEILDFSRMESGNISIEMDSISPAEVINECIMLTEHLAKEVDVTIHVDALETLPMLHVDRTRFKQVMVNLISNAIKYNIRGGTTHISAEHKDGKVSFMVTDTGAGIPLSKQKDLFTPFTRFADNAAAIEGTGIGLTISKQLVEAMEGTIDFSSTPGTGTTFTVTFKSTESATATASDTTVSHSDSVAKAPMLLYIDNEKQRIDSIRELINKWPQANMLVRRNSKAGIKAVTLMKPTMVLINDQFAKLESNTYIDQLKQAANDQTCVVLLSETPWVDTHADDTLALPTTIEDIIKVYKSHQGDTDV